MIVRSSLCSALGSFGSFYWRAGLQVQGDRVTHASKVGRVAAASGSAVQTVRVGSGSAGSSPGYPDRGSRRVRAATSFRPPSHRVSQSHPLLSQHRDVGAPYRLVGGSAAPLLVATRGRVLAYRKVEPCRFYTGTGQAYLVEPVGLLGRGKRP